MLLWHHWQLIEEHAINEKMSRAEIPIIGDHHSALMHVLAPLFHMVGFVEHSPICIALIDFKVEHPLTGESEVALPFITLTANVDRSGLHKHRTIHKKSNNLAKSMPFHDFNRVFSKRAHLKSPRMPESLYFAFHGPHFSGHKVREDTVTNVGSHQPPILGDFQCELWLVACEWWRGPAEMVCNKFTTGHTKSCVQWILLWHLKVKAIFWNCDGFSRSCFTQVLSVHSRIHHLHNAT